MNTNESQPHPVYTEGEVGAAYDAVLDAVRAAGMNPRLAYQSDDTGYIYEHGGKEYVLVLGLLDNAEVLDSSALVLVKAQTEGASVYEVREASEAQALANEYAESCPGWEITQTPVRLCDENDPDLLEWDNERDSYVAVSEP